MLKPINHLQATPHEAKGRKEESLPLPDEPAAPSGILFPLSLHRPGQGLMSTKGGFNRILSKPAWEIIPFTVTPN